MVDTVRAYCAPLREAGVDTVILGCTHYPLVAPMLQRTLGRGVALVTSGAPSRARSSTRSARAASATRATGEGDYRFLCTGDAEAFRALGTRFLQMPLEEVEHVDARRREVAGDEPRAQPAAAPPTSCGRHDRARLRAHARPARR